MKETILLRVSRKAFLVGARDPLTNHLVLCLQRQTLTLYLSHIERLSSLKSTLLNDTQFPSPNLGSITQAMLGICAKSVLQLR